MKHYLRTLGLSLATAAAGLALVAAPTRAGQALVMEDLSTIEAAIHVGVAPISSPTAAVSGSVDVGFQVTPQHTNRYVSTDKRFIDISVAPGSSVTLNCAYELTALGGAFPRDAFWTLKGGISNDVASSNSSFTRFIKYRIHDATSAPSGPFRGFIKLATRKAQAVEQSPKRGTLTMCVDLQITIPPHTAAGTIYTTVTHSIWSSAAVASPTPSPTPVPTATPTPLPSPYDEVVKQDGPGVYYHLDEPASNYPAILTFADSSGNGNDGEYMYGNPGRTGTVGWTSVSGALKLSSDPAIGVQNPYGLYSPYSPTVSSYTVEAWVKSTAPEFEIAMSSAYACSGFSVTVGGQLGDVTSHILPGQIGAGFGQIQLGTDEPNVEALGVVSTRTINDGSWHLVTATWVGTAGLPIATDQIRIYVDGNDVTGDAFQSGTPATPTAPLAVNDGSVCPNGAFIAQKGMGASNESAGADVFIDEYTIYPYGLSPAQIQNHYHAAGY